MTFYGLASLELMQVTHTHAHTHSTYTYTHAQTHHPKSERLTVTRRRLRLGLQKVQEPGSERSGARSGLGLPATL